MTTNGVLRQGGSSLRSKAMQLPLSLSVWAFQAAKILEEGHKRTHNELQLQQVSKGLKAAVLR